MTIIDLKITKETENYKFFWIQYTPWLFPDTLKNRSGFIMKNSGDCHWSDTGKRLSACTERAVLAWVENIEDTPVYVQQIGRISRASPRIKPKEEVSDIRKIIHSRIENHQEP